VENVKLVLRESMLASSLQDSTMEDSGNAGGADASSVPVNPEGAVKEVVVVAPESGGNAAETDAPTQGEVAAAPDAAAPTAVVDAPAAAAADVEPPAAAQEGPLEVLVQPVSEPPPAAAPLAAAPPAAAPPAAAPPAAAPPAAAPGGGRGGYKVFVGGLSYSTTDETMGSYFRSLGELLDSHVMLDRMTGRSRGFGFVTFCDDTGGRDSLPPPPHSLFIVSSLPLCVYQLPSKSLLKDLMSLMVEL
jgi:hypothetical protein